MSYGSNNLDDMDFARFANDKGVKSVDSYETHAEVYGKSSHSGQNEILDISNFECVETELESYCDITSIPSFMSGSEQADMYIGGGLHYVTIMVRVYAVDGSFTKAWQRACELLYDLEQYPILDEMDFSAREYAAHEDALNDALLYVPDHDGLDDGHENAIREIFYDMASNEEISLMGYYPEVSENEVIEGWEFARNRYYGELAEANMTAIREAIDYAHFGGLFEMAA